MFANPLALMAFTTPPDSIADAKHLELALAKDVVEFDEFHREAPVRFVDAIAVHGFLIGQAWKGTRHVGAQRD